MSDGRLINILAAIDALEKEKPTPFVNKDGNVDPFGAGRQNQWYRDGIAIMNLPSVQSKTSRIENALHGKTAEEQCDLIRWLVLDYAMCFTDSRAAIIEWLNMEAEDE